MNIASEAELNEILKGLEGAVYKVAEVRKGERTKKAPLPLRLVPYSRKQQKF